MQEVLARTIREEKEIYIGNEEVKLYVVTDDIILYMENPKESTHTHTHTHKILHKFCKVAGLKISIQC